MKNGEDREKARERDSLAHLATGIGILQGFGMPGYLPDDRDNKKEDDKETQEGTQHAAMIRRKRLTMSKK